jgi:hypothetical protein
MLCANSDERPQFPAHNGHHYLTNTFSYKKNEEFQVFSIDHYHCHICPHFHEFPGVIAHILIDFDHFLC